MELTDQEYLGKKHIRNSKTVVKEKWDEFVAEKKIEQPIINLQIIAESMQSAKEFEQTQMEILRVNVFSLHNFKSFVSLLIQNQNTCVTYTGFEI